VYVKPNNLVTGPMGIAALAVQSTSKAIGLKLSPGTLDSQSLKTYIFEIVKCVVFLTWMAIGKRQTTPEAKSNKSNRAFVDKR